jgi:D-alanine-D-alanine ligase
MRIAFTYNLKTGVSEEQAEFDTPETVAMLERAFQELGHQVTLIEASCSVRQFIDALEAARPDLVFNTAEGGVGRGREAYYPALFQRLGIPFTGADAYVCTVTLDKHLTKLLVSHHGVRVPGSSFVRGPDQFRRHDLRYPLMVKPNFEGSSMGITAESVVEDPAALERRAGAMLAQFPDGILIEEYITGRDVVVPFLEAASPETRGILEPAEYVYLTSTGKRFVIFELDMKMRGFEDVHVRSPAHLEPGQRAEAIRASRLAVDVLGVRDLGRMDYRLGEDGELYFLEMNALPSLEPGASIYLSGHLAGLDGVTGVMAKVIESACRRYPSLAAARVVADYGR